MRKLLTLLILILTLTCPLYAAEKAAPQPKVQLAILLDTSNSMDGLINQARAQLWKVVNECAALQKTGRKPVLHVALYEYGNTNLPAKEGYVRQVLPFSTDLDKVSEKLFALRTRGGDEFCGMVIDRALSLDWSPEKGDLKMIFIAGNEPFTQGPVDYKKSCKSAIQRGITVNTIFCGPWQTGVNTHWQDGARLADGRYMSIDQDRQMARIDAPQDEAIMKLNSRLNATYVQYGRGGAAGLKRQERMDAEAAKMAPGAAVQRAVAKSSHVYKQSWDLASAVQEKRVKLEEVDKDALPEEMQKMTPEERKAYIEKKIAERQKLQKQIKELSEAREKFIAKKRRELGEKEEDTLDAAMIQAVQKQAREKGFQTEK